MPDGRLYLSSHGKIHVFGADGIRRQAIDLRELGVAPRPSDFDVHADGRLLIADPNESALFRCAPSAAPCERIDPGLKRVPGQSVLPLNAAKLHIDEAGQRYYVSDNAGHNVVITDFSGKFLGRSTPMAISFPNQLSISAPGELTVVDTGHRRLATYEVASGAFGALKSEMPTRAPGVARIGRHLPFDSVRLPDGEVAVLVARDGMRDADVVVFDAAGTAARRVDLGDDSDPFDIEVWRGRLWISDATHYRFESVGFDGFGRAPIEDAAFVAELAEAARGPEMWKSIRLAAQVGMVLIPLLGILLMWRMGVRLGAAPAATAPADPPQSRFPASPEPAGVELGWVEVDPAFLARLRRRTAIIGWIYFVALLAIAGYMLATFRPLIFSAGGIVSIGPVMLLFPVVAVAFLVFMRRIDKPYTELRLGASPDGLRITGPRARDESSAWGRVYFDGKRILAGKRVIAHHVAVAGDVFASGPFYDTVIARVPRDNFVLPVELSLKRLRAYLL